VIEYLWKAADVFFAAGNRNAEDRVTERLRIILHGRPGAMGGGMRRSTIHRGLDATDRAPVDDCADYLVDSLRQKRAHRQGSRGLRE
jgi:hypothetical protein